MEKIIKCSHVFQGDRYSLCCRFTLGSIGWHTSILCMYAMRINLMFTADITCLLYRAVRPVAQTALCAAHFPQRHGAYWLIKAHHLNCSSWLQSCGVGVRWDNDAQLSEYILLPGWHSKQQSRHRPTNPDQNTYSQTQWVSVFTHKSQPLWSLFIPPSLSGFLLQVQAWFGQLSCSQFSHNCTNKWTV